MLYLLFYESLSNGWILESGTIDSYIIRHKDFNILCVNSFLWFYLRVDGTEKLVGKTGNDTLGDVDVTTTSKLFYSSEYMQVIHNVTNRGQSNHEIGLGFALDLDLDSSNGSNGDACGHQNIPPFKGIYSFHEDRNVTFLLRDTAFVTNVDTYSYNGRPGYGEWSNITDYEKVPDGSGGGIYFSWQKRTILSGESKQFSYVVGIGEYNPSYTLHLAKQLNEYYKPSTQIKVKIAMNGINKSNKIKVTRKVNESLLRNFDVKDTGEDQTFTDAFIAPTKGGKYILKYEFITPDNEVKNLEINLLINEIPAVEVIEEVKKSFFSSERVNISVQVKDDSKVTLFVLGENHNVLYESEIICDGEKKRTNAIFTIPPAEFETYHNFTVIAKDDLGYYSDGITFSYLFSRYRSSLISLDEPLDTKYRSGANLEIFGSIESREDETTVCYYTSVNDGNITMHQCRFYLAPSSNPFVINTNFTGIEEKIYKFKLYGIDNRQIETNIISHSFFIISTKHYFKCSDYYDDISYFVYILTMPVTAN